MLNAVDYFCKNIIKFMAVITLIFCVIHLSQGRLALAWISFLVTPAIFVAGVMIED